MDNVNVETLSNDELRNLLIKHGHQCGPVLSTTRKVYENKLKRLLSGGRDRGSPKSQSTPDRSSTTNSSGSGSKSGVDASNRGSDYYGDASDVILDDDPMEGEESFRYISPANDTPSSPYTGLGGSMTTTPPSSPTRTATKMNPTHRLDYNFQDGFASSKPTSGYSSIRSTVPKTSTVSYHTTGNATEAYRRSTIPAQVTQRTAAPTIYTAPSKRYFPFNLDMGAVIRKSKEWAPTVAKIIVGFVALVFFTMVIKRALRESGYYNEEEDEEVQELPA